MRQSPLHATVIKLMEEGTPDLRKLIKRLCFIKPHFLKMNDRGHFSKPSLKTWGNSGFPLPQYNSLSHHHAQH